MSRTRLHDSSTTVTLFPFLAVLLCTMGVLLLVLVVMAKVSREKALLQAQAEKQTIQRPPSAETDRHVEQKLNVLNRQLGKLDQTREKTREVLRREQLRLQHIEDHMRRLEKQLDSLRQAALELELMEQEHSDDRMQAKRELVRLHKLIAEMQEAIAIMEEELRNAPHSYAIVPYRGSRGTRRRPLYIECRGNEVVLQPEGVSLKPRDFAPPLGAGNPLASALRAAREFLVNEAPEMQGASSEEPYPLLLVRPDGVGAYYRVRAAIESWDSDFGYEFVDADWNLQFPAANPQLAAVESQAVYQARARQQQLAAAAPIAYANTLGATAMANSFEVQAGGGRPGLMEDDFSSASGESSRRSSSAGEGLAPGGSRQELLASETKSARARLESHRQAPFSGKERAYQASRSSELPLANQVAKVAISGPGSGGNQGDRRAPSGEGSTAASGATGAAKRHLDPADRVAADLRGDHSNQDQQKMAFQDAKDAAFELEASATGGQMAGSRPPASRRNSGLSDPTAAHTAGKSRSGSGETPSDPTTQGGPALPLGMASTKKNNPSGGSNSLSLTRPASEGMASRGGNWAFGGGHQQSQIPVRRAIRVVVRQNRLSVLPDRYEMSGAGWIGSGGRDVKLQGPTRLALDELVAGLREHVEQWGIAGSGLYWRPVLALKVAPDGQSRARDLVRLLENSGIEIRDTSTAKRVNQPDAKNTR
jgi:hypothetical protein